jgi:hypothetical protein
MKTISKRLFKTQPVDSLLQATAWEIAKNSGMSHWSQAITQAYEVLEKSRLNISIEISERSIESTTERIHDE